LEPQAKFNQKCKKFQGTTSVVPKKPKITLGFSPCGIYFQPFAAPQPQGAPSFSALFAESGYLLDATGPKQ
jgi:hypothetical protein